PFPPLYDLLYYTCLFFFMLRRPPTSPLFPYTTLFRSASAEVVRVCYPIKHQDNGVIAMVLLQPLFQLLNATHGLRPGTQPDPLVLLATMTFQRFATHNLRAHSRLFGEL